MKETSLRILLPGFAMLIAWLIFSWKTFRNTIGTTYTIRKNKTPPIIYLIPRVYLAILFIIFVIIFVYSFLTPFYFVFFPIDGLDRPFINAMGVVLLKVSIAWIIYTSFEADKLILTHQVLSPDTLTKRWMAIRRKYSAGLVIMSGGLFVCISSLASSVVFIATLFCFVNTLRKSC